MRVQAITCMWLAGLLGAGAAVAGDPCSKRELRRPSTVTLELDGIQRGLHGRPAFYVIGQELRFVLFFDAEQVVGVVQKALSAHPGLATTLQRMRADLPLREDTDLRKYGLRDGSFLALLDHFAAELLDAGHGLVDLWPLHDRDDVTEPAPDLTDPVTLKRVEWATRDATGRQYCITTGRGLFFVVDEVS